jgi:hypothetical protein
MPEFPLSYSILLRGVRTSFPMENSIVSEKGLEPRGIKFATSISLELLNCARELIFCEKFELDKGVIGIRFVMERVKPGIPREVIYEDDIVFAATH